VQKLKKEMDLWSIYSQTKLITSDYKNFFFFLIIFIFLFFLSCLFFLQTKWISSVLTIISLSLLITCVCGCFFGIIIWKKYINIKPLDKNYGPDYELLLDTEENEVVLNMKRKNKDKKSKKDESDENERSQPDSSKERFSVT
jgi:energy-coupling factor transporter transmembrane protein EcfT